MPQNSFEQLKMSKKFGGSPPKNPSWVTRAEVGDPQFSEFFFSVDMSVLQLFRLVPVAEEGNIVGLIVDVF